MQLSDPHYTAMTITDENISVLPLQGVIQHYAWGGNHFIPQLTGKENPEQKPFAELWMGAHHRGPASLNYLGKEMTLPELIEQNPETLLGKKVSSLFDNKLPFLFKILDVNQMLSIQSHPTKAAAEIGFKAENDRGIPITAAHRNYKDDNHKPEVMVALTDFWLLHGFKTPEAIRVALETVPEFSSLLPILAEGGIKQLYKTIMEWPQETINQILAPLSERLLNALEQGELHPDQANYWAAIGFRDMVLSPDQMDRGIFSIYLFNLVTMQAGQAIFQDAGIPHAYLRGVNVELMANSDNVFRGGLTQKHIDVAELMNNLVFDPVTPNIINGEKLSNTETAYRTPAPDFELRKIEIQPKEVHHNASTNSPSILILMEGQALVNEQLLLRRGEILFIPANIFCTIEATKEKTILFKALVP